MFGTIPAKGFYIRHAHGVTLNDIHFHYKQADGRPLLVTDDADGLVYRNMTVNGKEYKN